MSAYSDALNALSPIAYWRLGEAAGPTAVDEMGSHDGTYENGPTLGQDSLIVTDAANDSVLFAAVAREHVIVPHAAALSLGATCSIVAWVKFTSMESQGCAIGKMLASGSWQGWLVGANVSGNKAYFRTKGAGAAVWLEADDALDDGEPHMIVATLAGGTGKIYVDGGAAQNSATMPTPTANTAALYIGERIDDGHTFTGVVDEPAVFDYELSQSEIQNLYNAATTEATTVYQCGSCALTFYYHPVTLKFMRVECSGPPEGCQCSFKAVEHEGETWEDSFTSAGSKDCPYEMLYTDDGEGGIGNITVTAQMKRV